MPKQYKNIAGFASILVLVFLIAFIALIGIYFVSFHKSPVAPEKVVSNSTKSAYYKTLNNCSKYGMGNPKDYLKTYTVKAGDTLLSIAKNELGDTSRVYELIKINPQLPLSLQKPFLEVGWNLYLPPDGFDPEGGPIGILSGNVSFWEKGVVWGIKAPGVTGGSFPSSLLTSSAKDLNEGSCVTIVYQVPAHGPNKLFKIIPQ